MGSSTSVRKEALLCGLEQFRESEWNKTGDLLKRSPSIEVLHSINDYESSDIYESVRSSSFVEEYVVEYRQDDDLLQHLKQIEWRNQCPQLVHILLIAGNYKEVQLCGSDDEVKMYLEHIPLRLNKLIDIPFPENLYVLRETLLGFQKIYSQYKELVIKQEHICVNYESKVKVWMNQNLISPDPQNKEVRHPLKTEAKIVSAIVDIISKNTDQSTEVIKIKDFLRKKYQKLTFKLALRGIQQISSLLKIKIPKCLESTKILFSNNISFERSKVKQIVTQPNFMNNSTFLNGSVAEDLQIPTLDFSKFCSHSTSVKTSKMSDSCSTELNTPQKQPQICDSFQTVLIKIHFPLKSSEYVSPFLKKQRFDKPSLRESNVSLIHSLDYNEEVLIEGKKLFVHPENIKITYGERKTEFSSQHLILTKWTYWQNSKEEKMIDPQIAADLELFRQQN